MNRTARKWLALLLSLLLGFAPLQGAWAGFVPSGGSETGMMDHSMDHPAAMAAASMENCADCPTNADCADGGCAGEHPCAMSGCAAPAMIPAPLAAHIRIDSRQPSPLLAVADTPAPPLTALFRPPIR